jgi:hypothetical protein
VPGRDLVRAVRSTATELRSALATGRRVSLTIQGDTRRVEGLVQTVSPTDAFAIVSGVHVPLSRVLGVHLPSRLGDSTVRPTETFHGAGNRVEDRPGQTALDVGC